MPVTLKEHLESLTAMPVTVEELNEGCNLSPVYPQGAVCPVDYLQRQHYIYFVQSEDGFIKIGCSQNVKSRFRTIQGDNHMKIKLIGKMKGGYDLEAKLHRKFKKFRKRGEWFHPAPELIGYIASNKMYRRKV